VEFGTFDDVRRLGQPPSAGRYRVSPGGGSRAEGALGWPTRHTHGQPVKLARLFAQLPVASGKLL
jgi:hypothetical protein